MAGPARKSPYAFLRPLARHGRGGTVQRVQDVVRDAIVRLDLPPGTFVDKAALCARLGVSRFPVSEALGRLAAEGFVEVLPQRGTRVARIDLVDCRQAMFIRRALEDDRRFQVAGLSATSKSIATRSGDAAALTAAALDGFDAVIVGGLERLTTAEVNALERFMREREGAVVLVPDARPSNAPALDLVRGMTFTELRLQTPCRCLRRRSLPGCFGLAGCCVANTIPTQPSP